LSSNPPFPFVPGSPARLALTGIAPDHTVAKNTTETLLPSDVFHDLTIQNGATLILGDGTYNFANVHAGQHVTITVTDNTIIQVDGKFTLNDDTSFGKGTQALAKVFAGSDGVTGLTERTFEFGENDIVGGQFYAPNGILGFGRHADGTGRFWADKIDSDFN